MKKSVISIYIITIILLSNIVYSQPVTWYRTWGIYERSEQGERVVQTYDGGYASMIMISYGGANDYFSILKYDYLGNLQWQKVIVDTTSRMLYDMQQTSDSGFIFAGYTYGALLIKTDKNGNLQWQRNYPNLNSGTKFYSVQLTNDKGYIASGSYTDYVNPSSKGIVIKVDSLGYVQWERQYMDSIQNGFGVIIQGLDGKYYVAGTTKNNYPSASYGSIKKLNSLGNIIWNNIFYADGGGAGYVLQLKDGSIITCGSGNLSNHYPVLAKFDTSGNTKWIKVYPSTKIFLKFITKEFFDNLIITNDFDKGGQYNTISIWKIDSNGNIKITKNLSFSSYNYIGTSCIKQSSDSGFIIVGGATLTDSLYNPHVDALIVKTDSNFNSPVITGINSSISNFPEKFELFQNFPNPFNPVTTIQFILPTNGLVGISIYDLLGKKVFSSNEIRNTGLNKKKFDFRNLNVSSGIYFIQISFNSQKKLIKSIFLK